jgi:hypothetical protein
MLPFFIKLLNIGIFFAESTFNTLLLPFAFLVVLGIYYRENKKMDSNTGPAILGVIAMIVLVASLFSPKKGVTNTVLSIIIALGVMVGLVMNPNPETFFLIVFIVSAVVYGSSRYWRSAEGFLQRR